MYRFVGFKKSCSALFLIAIGICICSLSYLSKSIAQDLEANQVKTAAEEYNPVYSARDSVLSYFYPESGVIAGVDNQVVKVNFQTDKSLKKGMRFSVFREGKPFYHPVTRKPIGKAEEFIGKIEINKAGEGAYLCSIVNGQPITGDIVRITSSRIKLAFFQDRQAEWALSEMFYNSLKDSSRFNFMESYTKTYNPEELSRLAREMGAEAVLFFSTPVKEEKLFLNVKLFWAEDASAFAEIEEAAGPDFIKKFAHESEIISMESIGREPWGSFNLAAGKFIAMGDVDGNGEQELVVSDGNNIQIYSYKQEPKEIWFIKGHPGDTHLSIDVLDFNGNGRAEIFVTSLKNKRTMNSFVLEFDPAAGYKRIWEKAPYSIRVINNTLFMQAFTSYGQFSGPVYKAVWKDGRYQTGAAAGLPEGIDIYGFTSVDWHNSGKPAEAGKSDLSALADILAFDDNGYLNLYSENKLVWRSKTSYMKFNISFDKASAAVVSTSGEKWVVKGRLLAVDTKQGQNVLVIKKVPLVKMVPGLGSKKAEVYSLWWDGAMMNETLLMSGISGAVSDYWINGGNLLLIARQDLSAVFTGALSGNLQTGSKLYYYNLTGK
jgi:hypothetical protein